MPEVRAGKSVPGRSGVARRSGSTPPLHRGPGARLLHETRALSELAPASPEVVEALRTLGIRTVHDLLSWPALHKARLLVSAAREGYGLEGEMERLVDKRFRTLPAEAAPDWPTAALMGLSAKDGRILEGGGIRTIGELADHPVAGAAEAVLGCDNGFSEPPSAPCDLIPTSARGPVSEARYASFVKELDFRGVGLTIDRACLTEAPLASILEGPNCHILSTGYLLGHRQRWYDMGPRLGEVVDSLPLAPGESRNIAVVDWRRDRRLGRTEDTDTVERLDNQLVNRRALDEVTTAVAREHQSGNTETSASTAASAASFVGAGAAIGAVGVGVPAAVVGAILGIESGPGALATGAAAGSVGAAVGGAAGAAAGGMVHAGVNTLGKIHADTKGDREISAELNQNIHQTTNQKASLARSLWSTVVLKDAEAESDRARTSNVTNYNHMHALTVQYYEVLQHYHVRTEATRVEPLLFLPFTSLRFDDETIEQFWPLLRTRFHDEALIQRVEEALTHDGIYIPPDAPMDPTKVRTTKVTVRLRTPDLNVTTPLGCDLVVDGVEKSVSSKPGTRTSEVIGSTTFVFEEFETVLPYWTKDITAVRISRLGGLTSLGAKVWVRASVIEEGPGGNSAQFEWEDLGTETLPPISTAGSEATFPWDIHGRIERDFQDAQALQDSITQANTDRREALEQVRARLKRRSYHYTRFILNNIEPEVLQGHLDHLSVVWDGQSIPLHLIADTVPVGVSGNRILLPMKDALEKLQSMLKKTGTLVDFISFPYQLAKWSEKELREIRDVQDLHLPTAGLFAEAVLGRSNSAEKIDLTRWWNWQESPIPYAAPAIVPVQLQSRHDDESVSPTVPDATLTPAAPVAMPDPGSGVAGALKAVTTPNIFRDMSKSEELTKVLGDLATLAGNIAGAASTMTGQAASDALQAASSMGDKVAGIVNGMMSQGGGAESPRAPDSLTTKGGTLNSLSDLYTRLQNGEVPQPGEVEEILETLGLHPGGGTARPGGAGGDPGGGFGSGAGGIMTASWPGETASQSAFRAVRLPTDGDPVLRAADLMATGIEAPQARTRREFPIGAVVNHTVIVATTGTHVVYLEDGELYMQPDVGYRRDQNLVALGIGAGHALWTEELAKAEMAAALAFVGGVIGIAGAATMTLAQALTYLNDHPGEAELLEAAIRELRTHLPRFVAAHPACARCILAEVVWQGMLNIPTHSTSQQAAWMLGKFLRGGMIAGSVASLGLKEMLKQLAVHTLLTGSAFLALHAPVIGGAATAEQIAEQAATLKSRLETEGFTADVACLETCLGSLLGDPDSGRALLKISEAAEKLTTILDGMATGGTIPA